MGNGYETVLAYVGSLYVSITKYVCAVLLHRYIVSLYKTGIQLIKHKSQNEYTSVG